MFALLPFMENFDSFTECFSAYWETIKMKCNIALLWLSSLANSSTQEADVHTPVTVSTEKHGAKARKSQQSKILPSTLVYGYCGSLIALAYEPVLKGHARGYQQNWIFD